MSLTRLTSLSMFAVVVAACGSETTIEPPFGSWHASATYECVGPLSESGVAIYLSGTEQQSPEPSPPYVRVIIREEVLEDLSGRTWAVAEPGADATAWSVMTLTGPEVATSGQVRVNAVSPENTIDGWVVLTFPSGRVEQSFQARWLTPVQYCI